MKDISKISDINDVSPDYPIAETVDTRGARCPIPLLRAKVALKGVGVGEYVRVLATDPSAKPDFDAMLRHLPHELVDYCVCGDSPRVDCFVIRKG